MTSSSPESAGSGSRHPYETLTPDAVLDALAAVGLHGDGRLMALSSYENRVYQARLEDGTTVVAKFYRPGRWSDAQILEEHAFAAELMDAEVPMVGPLALAAADGRGGAPATLHHHAGFAFSVSPSRGGRRPELDDFEVLEWTGRFLGRMHAVGAARPFVHRPALDLGTFGTASRDWLLDHAMVPLDVQGSWRQACDLALDSIAAHEGRMRTGGLFDANGTAPPAPPANDFPPDDDADGEDGDGPPDGPPPMRRIRLHGDCHPGNILWTPTELPGGGPHFVDLDDARTGFAVQDLWMLLSGDRAQRTAQLSALLDGYEQFRSFDRRELALIEPLRTLRLIHYSAWLARRWDDPIFPINFPWFGSSDYWRGQVRMLEEQVEAMAEEPLYA